MAIGTSKGAFYEDEFHYESAQWDSKYDDNVVTPNDMKTNQDLEAAELNPTSGLGVEVGMRGSQMMPFPNNSNPDTDFKNRFPGLPPSGILNDLKKPSGDTVPLVRKISDAADKSFKGGYLGVKPPHVEGDANDFWFKDDWQGTWDSAVGRTHHKGDPKGYVDKLGPDWEGFSSQDSDMLWLRKRGKPTPDLSDLVS